MRLLSVPCLVLQLGCLLVPSLLPAANDASPNDAVKTAAQKGLAFLEKEGVAWYEERSCLSCHHIPFQVWAHREGRRRGISMEQKKLDAWVAWCVELAEPKGGNDVLAMLMNFIPRDVVPPGDAQKKLETLPAKIMSFQKPEGFWVASGQFHAEHWTKPEADEAATRLMLQSLNTSWADVEKTKASRERALAWLKAREEQSATTPPQSIRTHAARLAFAVNNGDTARQSALCEILLSLQRPDGGWCWKMDVDTALPNKDDGSDPIATGEVLYLLNAARAKGKDVAGPRAVAYLLKTQREDGAWYQDHKRVSNKIRKETNPNVDAIYTYWATAWATLGLLSMLPEVATKADVTER